MLGQGNGSRRRPKNHGILYSENIIIIKIGQWKLELKSFTISCKYLWTFCSPFGIFLNFFRFKIFTARRHNDSVSSISLTFPYDPSPSISPIKYFPINFARLRLGWYTISFESTRWMNKAESRASSSCIKSKWSMWPRMFTGKSSPGGAISSIMAPSSIVWQKRFFSCKNPHYGCVFHGGNATILASCQTEAVACSTRSGMKFHYHFMHPLN